MKALSFTQRRSRTRETKRTPIIIKQTMKYKKSTNISFNDLVVLGMNANEARKETAIKLGLLWDHLLVYLTRDTVWLMLSA